jgi:putative ABC transport system permease protein
MRALDKKALRDLWHLRGPGVAIALVVACGAASFVSMRSMVYHLRDAQASYYRTARFADVFTRVRRAPFAVLREAAAIPGVAAIEARVALDVVLDVPGLPEPAVGHVVGVPTRREPAVNLLTIRQGRALAPGARDEVLLTEGFAVANALAPGDSVGAVLNGRWERLHVVGIALSPEFVYAMGQGSILPDERRFGVLWMDEDAAAAAFGMRGAWNEAAVALAPGAPERDVLARLDRVLERYGSLGAFGRSLHVSHRFLSDEIEQNRTFAAVIPAIFLGVAAFLLHLVLSRIVASQREQIGMLKAFGVRNAEVVRHFVILALGPVLLGSLAGCALGLWAAGKFAEIYESFYRIPNVHFVPRMSVLAIAVAIGVVAALLGAVSAVRRVVRLPAAEAMRPETPARYRRGIAERLGLGSLLSPVGRMTLRALERRPGRAALSVLGLALGVAVVMVGNYGYDAISFMRDVQFGSVQREDVAVTFTAARGTDALHELGRLPGVLRVEPTRAAAVRLRHEQRSRQVALIGVPPDAELRRVVDGRGRPVVLPGGGIMVSEALATLLAVRVGDTVRVEVLTGTRAARDVRIGATLDDLIGTNAYATADELLRLLDAGEAIDGAVLAVDPAALDGIYARLKRMPGVAGVGVRAAVLRSFNETIAMSFTITLGVMVSFATALAAGVVYNTARIALAERGRDLASLRVLGFTRGEVARMLFGEQAALSALAIPAGFAVGVTFCWLMARSLESDLFRLPLVIQPRTYALAAGVLVASSVGSAILVRRRLDRLDLVTVLKTRE